MITRLVASTTNRIALQVVAPKTQAPPVKTGDTLKVLLGLLQNIYDENIPLTHQLVDSAGISPLTLECHITTIAITTTITTTTTTTTTATTTTTTTIITITIKGCKGH